MSLQNKMGIKVKLFCVFVQYRLVSELFSMSPKWNSAVGRSREKFCYLQIERHISFLSQTVFVRIFKLIIMNILCSSAKVIKLLKNIPWEALKALGWWTAVVETVVIPDLDPRSLPSGWCSVPFWLLKFSFMFQFMINFPAIIWCYFTVLFHCKRVEIRFSM